MNTIVFWRGPIAIACLCATVAVGAHAADTGAAVPQPAPAAKPAPLPAPATFSPELWRRPVSIRVRHTKLNPHKNANARRLGRSVASLHPTWVTGTLRYARDQYPTRNEARTWKEIRRIVRARNPRVQFDVVLNAEQFRTPASIRLAMRRLRAKLRPNGWFFDFLTSAFRKHPRMIRTAVNSAHAHGEWIGGNVFGIAKKRPMPVRMDFYSVQDAGLGLNVKAVRRLARKEPVLYHLNSNPQKPRSGGCRFIRALSTKGRRQHVRQRAAQQLKNEFRVAYPVLFPQCLKPRHRARHKSFLYAYNAFRDPPMAKQIRELLDRYDPAITGAPMPLTVSGLAG
jgi:hypothetical protein